MFGVLTIMRKLLNHPTLLYHDENTTAQEYKQFFPKDFPYKAWELSNKFLFIIDILK